MPAIEIHLSDDEFLKLEEAAVRERREPVKQAEVFVLTALGCWPLRPLKSAAKSPAKPKAASPNHGAQLTGISHA